MGRPSPSFWHRRRVFVTGCTGFLGAWVVRELLARGAVVVGLVRDRMRPSDLFDDRLFERIAVVRGRIEDRWRLESALAVHGIETVFHLAVPAVALSGEHRAVSGEPDDPLVLLTAHRSPLTAQPAVVLANSTDPTHHLAARWARTLLTAVKRSSPTAEVVIPVPAGDATGRAEVAAAFARRTGAAVGVALLPRLFGGGDRRWSRLVPWTVRAVLTGRSVEPPRSYELAESYLYVRDAARACLGLAEALAGDPEAWAGRAAPVPATATGADLFEVLTAPYLPSPFAGEGSGARDQCPVPLLDAVAETARWYRRSFHTPAAAEAVVPARFAA